MVKDQLKENVQTCKNDSSFHGVCQELTACPCSRVMFCSFKNPSRVKAINITGLIKPVIFIKGKTRLILQLPQPIC